MGYRIHGKNAADFLNIVVLYTPADKNVTDYTK